MPTVGGVALACVSKNIGFTLEAFTAAVLGNVFSALRTVSSKILMKGLRADQNMSGANFFGVLTIYSSVLVTPIAIWMEYDDIVPALRSAAELESSAISDCLLQSVLACASGYVCGEVSFKVLELVSPITYAVGNTLKRVFVIVTAIIIFSTPMSRYGYIGSAVGIAGACAYSVACKHFQTTYLITCTQSGA